MDVGHSATAKDECYRSVSEWTAHTFHLSSVLLNRCAPLTSQEMLWAPLSCQMAAAVKY